MPFVDETYATLQPYGTKGYFLTMQATVICNHCGAESISDVRFCRQCGKEFTDRQPMSVTEGTTRIFDTPHAASDPFANFNNWAGPLDKPNTNPIVIPTGKETQILSRSESKSNTLLIFGGAIAFVSVAFIALVLSLVFYFSPTNAPVAPPRSEPPIVQQPPAPAADFSKLIYPDAVTVTKLGNGSTILVTSDSVEKVAKWYTGKLTPESDIKTPESRIIVSEGISVIIEREGRGTKIILAQEAGTP